LRPTSRPCCQEPCIAGCPCIKIGYVAACRPQPAWRRADGTWVPSAANFTSLASPDTVGSGKTALMTLLHEGECAVHTVQLHRVPATRAIR